jgi:type IV secretion system protein VirB6
MIGAVHAALMILVMKVAGTMVSGWSVLGLAHKTGLERDEPAAVTRTNVTAQVAGVAVDQARAAAQSQARSVRIPATARMAANDAGVVTTTRRSSRVVEQGESRPATVSPQFQSRAKGVGSRFRAAPARRSEKLK